MLKNRREAGRLLAGKLDSLTGRTDVLVLGVPRGGVPVAWEVAQALRAPLDILLARRLPVPGRDPGSSGLGLVATGGIRILDEAALTRLRVSRRQLEGIVAREEALLARREGEYLGGHPPLPIKDRTVVLVDDGMETGATMRAALSALAARQPARIVVAVPAAPPEICEELRAAVDSVRCVMTPRPFESLARWYEYFEPTTDGEVRELLAIARERNPAVSPFPWAGDADMPAPWFPPEH